MTQTLKTFSKTVTASDITTTNTLPAQESRDLSLSAEALSTLMFTLTDMYADPYLAILREYTTNARDAHMRANQTRPIEVTLPSFLSSSFIVKDFGVGMSKDDLLNVYAQYGNSTKRNDMGQIGAYGLGCKCALTLVDQFTINSVQDGMRTVAVMSRNDRGGSMDILSHESTQDDNGTTVTIAIPNSSKFNTNVPSFFSTWKPNTVLVNGEKPHDSIYEDGYYRHKNILIKPSGNYRRHKLYFLIEGFAYVVKQELSNVISVPTSFSSVSTDIYVEIPIGLVDFTPARESLRYTERVNNLIRETTDYIKTHFREIVYAHIAEAETRGEAVQRVQEWRISPTYEPRPLWKKESVTSRVDLGYAANALCRNARETRLKRVQERYIPITSSSDGDMKVCIVTGELPVADSYMTRIVRSEFSLNNGENDEGESAYVYFVKDKSKIDTAWITDNENITIADAKTLYESFKTKQAEERKRNPRPRVPRDSVPKKTVANDTLSYPVMYMAEGKPTYGYMTMNDVLQRDNLSKAYYVTTDEYHKSEVGGYSSYYAHRASDIESNIIQDNKYFLKALDAGEGTYIFVITSPRSSEAFSSRLAKAFNITPHDALQPLLEYVRKIVSPFKDDKAVCGVYDDTRTLAILRHLNEEAKELLNVPFKTAIELLNSTPELDLSNRRNIIMRSIAKGASKQSISGRSAYNDLTKQYPLIANVMTGAYTRGVDEEISLARELSIYMIAKNTSDTINTQELEG